jgi:prepilin-type N-terminal cleavage/methylation domain-containing protein
VRSKRGFTLIEVMVAAAVLGIAGTAFFSLLSGSLSNLAAAEDLHRYHLACQDVMDRVLLLSSLPPGGEIEGNLDSVNARYRVIVTPWLPQSLDERPSEGVMKIDVEVSWQGRSGERSVKLETVRSAALNYEIYDYREAIATALPQ